MARTRPTFNPHRRLSSESDFPSASTPALPRACVSPPLKENDPPNPSTTVVTNVQNYAENVWSTEDDTLDTDDDDEEVDSNAEDDDALPDLTDPSWEAPSSHKRHKSNKNKGRKKMKPIHNSSFIKGRDPKLMKDAWKVFKQKQKMFSMKPANKSLSDIKQHERRIESAPDPKPSASEASSSHSQLPSKVSANSLRAFIPHASEPSPDDLEVEKRKAQIRDNILRAFTQCPTNKPTPTDKDSLVLHEDVDTVDEENHDFSIAVISDIQGNATSLFASNCDDDDEKGYESDQTVTFEPPVNSDLDQLTESCDMQCTITNPTLGDKEFISKRKCDMSADEENSKKLKSNPTQPIALQNEEMEIIQDGISSHVSTVLCSGPKLGIIESKGREETNNTGGNNVPCNDLALGMTIPEIGDLESRSKNQCGSPKRSTDEPVTPQSGVDMHPAPTKLVWSKLNELTRKRKQCDEKIKQTWEEHNKKIAVLEEQKAKYEKEIESLMNQHAEMDNISQESFRNQLTTCTIDNSSSDGSQSNLQLESASVVEGELCC